jgi:hypothetical protein
MQDKAVRVADLGSPPLLCAPHTAPLTHTCDGNITPTDVIALLPLALLRSPVQDGISSCGRLGALCGIFSLAFYAVSLSRRLL